MVGVPRADGRSATRPLVPFVAAGVVAMLIVGVGASMLLARTYRSEELGDAEAVADALARGPVEASLSDGVVTGDAPAVALLDGTVRHEVLGKVVVAVKLRVPGGAYVYSTDPGVVGTDPPLDSTDTEPLRTGRPSGDFSTLHEADDAPERAIGLHLIEVYDVVHTPTGSPLLLETYVAFSAVRSEQSIFVRSLPALIGALVLLEAVQLPLALSLLRRVQRAERRRDELFEHAMSVSEAERQRIAHDLHDGVVQDLAALNFSLTQLAAHVGADDAESAAALRQAATTTRRSIQALRNLLVDLYPASLHDAGLSTALHDLAAANLPDTRSHVWVDPSLELTDGVQALIFRGAQEAVRNAARHAGATTLDVSVAREGRAVVLEVVDDGRGFRAPVNGAANGHMGLRLLSSLAAGVGGRLDVVSAPGEGTRVRMEVPG
jgi:signal transduction histidine kinase